MMAAHNLLKSVYRDASLVHVEQGVARDLFLMLNLDPERHDDYLVAIVKCEGISTKRKTIDKFVRKVREGGTRCINLTARQVGRKLVKAHVTLEGAQLSILCESIDERVTRRPASEHDTNAEPEVAPDGMGPLTSAAPHLCHICNSR